jgi:hypothetical protein
VRGIILQKNRKAATQETKDLDRKLPSLSKLVKKKYLRKDTKNGKRSTEEPKKNSA